MAIEATTSSTWRRSLQVKHIYVMAVTFLVVGVAIAYLFHKSASATAHAEVAASVNPHSLPGGAMGHGHVPTLEEMKQMADMQAAPLLDKLKSDPKNSAVLAQLGALYHTSHQFKEAAVYYGQAVQADPRNVPLRTKLATSLYRSGDVDGAIAELSRALSYEPGDANALFDLGMIRLQGKLDGKGALAAWRQLLKSNPQLSPERKAEVQKLMADVLTTQSQNRR